MYAADPVIEICDLPAPKQPLPPWDPQAAMWQAFRQSGYPPSTICSPSKKRFIPDVRWLDSHIEGTYWSTRFVVSPTEMVCHCLADIPEEWASCESRERKLRNQTWPASNCSVKRIARPFHWPYLVQCTHDQIGHRHLDENCPPKCNRGLVTCCTTRQDLGLPCHSIVCRSRWAPVPSTGGLTSRLRQLTS